ncbi:hypothetical protein PYW07_012064 [Mythimna separata]|uniref:Peptidase aspartic putative domain-containing protein n=1 Tax=Mythimna separata TaxID=271217 RepID=A0AAD7YKI5_MYTSE|nr:hypothetical protein PYW07_012064 [Mythimna separata]
MLSTLSNSTDPQRPSYETLSSRRANLPRIELPNFNGSYDDWPMFRDMFTSLVHSNTSLCNVEKLHYLNLSLVGEPKELLKHVNGNYEQAWTSLAQRYENKHLIVHSLLHKLFTQKKLISPSAVQIRNLIDTTSQCLHNLKNQEIPVESWDQIIIYTILSKLDVETHIAWEVDSYKGNSDKLPSWEELKAFLETKYRTLEMVNPTAKREQTNVKAKSFDSLIPEDKTHKSPTKSCSMCNAEHHLCHCQEFCKLQPNERKEFIKKNKLCFNCLTSGHSVKRCRNPISCRKCNRRHHTLLHQPSSRQSDKVKIRISHRQIEDEQKIAEHSDNPEAALSTRFMPKRSTALLATALVQVRGREGHKTVLRALIDLGAQVNFISERAVQLLKVKRSRTLGMIAGFGTTQTVSHVIQVELSSMCEKEVKLNIKTYLMPTLLTSHFPSQTIAASMDWPHLKGLTLADSNFNLPGRIDMLLGVEVCAQILKADVIKGPPGSPCAQNTSLGWILFGKIKAQTSEQPILVTS